MGGWPLHAQWEESCLSDLALEQHVRKEAPGMAAGPGLPGRLGSGAEVALGTRGPVRGWGESLDWECHAHA